MGVTLVGLLFVGCTTTATSEPIIEPTAKPTIEPTVEPTESAPVGAAVGLLDQGEGFVEMYDAPHPSAAVIAQVLVDMECIVVSGPFTAEEVTFWKLSCLEETQNLGDFYWVGWIDVTMLEVIN